MGISLRTFQYERFWIGSAYLAAAVLAALFWVFVMWNACRCCTCVCTHMHVYA